MLSAPRAELFPSTQQKLDALYASGKVNPAELGDVLEQLKTFTEETANTIVDKFQEADLGNIRSKSGFLMVCTSLSALLCVRPAEVSQ